MSLRNLMVCPPRYRVRIMKIIPSRHRLFHTFRARSKVQWCRSQARKPFLRWWWNPCLLLLFCRTIWDKSIFLLAFSGQRLPMFLRGYMHLQNLPHKARCLCRYAPIQSWSLYGISPIVCFMIIIEPDLKAEVPWPLRDAPLNRHSKWWRHTSAGHCRSDHQTCPPVRVYTRYNTAIILFSIGATEVIAI